MMRGPVRVFIGLGANIDPEQHTRAALEHIARQLRLIALSRFYYTEPIGRPEQPRYLNGVALVETDMSAHDVKFKVLRPVETALGRIRSRDPYAARPIDLDILLFGEDTISETGLIVPDPELCRRAFLAAGVLELAPALVLPGAGAPLAELVNHTEIASLEAAEAFTREMQERFFSNEQEPH